MLRIKLRYDDVDAMTERFAPHVGRSGLFLPTRSMQPIGTEVKFELRLANEQAVLVGLGRVQHVKEPDPADPKAAYGIGVELMRVTRESRELILKLLARRRQLGLPEVALPRAEEIDAARRQIADASAVPQPIVIAPSAPSAPIAPLAAEPPRRKRRPVSELIESASGPIASSSLAVPGLELDEEVDVGKALARARMLATGDLDQELEQLRDHIAAPLAEISIEAASAELARQLGGVAVRARSQGWAPPPAVAAEPSPAPSPDPEPAIVAAEPEPEPEPAVVAAEPEPEPAIVAAEPEPEPAVVAAEPVIEHPGAPVAQARIWTDDQDDESEHTQIGSLTADPSSFEETVVLPGDAVAVLGDPVDVPEEPEEIEEIEEIEEFEILAEADAADADLLAAHGEAELAAAELAAAPAIPPPAAVHLPQLDPDFASRLDLGEDSDLYPADPDPASAPLTLDPRELAADAPRSHDPEREFDSHHAGFAPPQRFDQSDALTVPPELRHDRPSAFSRARTPARELEAALGALDVDLDGPSAQHAPVRQTGATRVVRPATGPSGRAPRASTEDGILINFDDDDE